MRPPRPAATAMLLGCAVVVASRSIATQAPTPTPAPTLQHDPIDCIVAGSFPIIPACFEPQGLIARGRVHFQVEGWTTWYYVEMKPATTCWTGVLPKPSRSIVDKRIRYYVEVTTRSLEAGRTPDHAALVVRSAQDCQEPLVAAISPTGPAAVLPSLPTGFSLGGVSVPLVVAGAGAAVGGIAIVARPGDAPPSPAPPSGPIGGPRAPARLPDRRPRRARRRRRARRPAPRQARARRRARQP